VCMSFQGSLPCTCETETCSAQVLRELLAGDAWTCIDVSIKLLAYNVTAAAYHTTTTL
jgi:hypothetical protein